MNDIEDYNIENNKGHNYDIYKLIVKELCKYNYENKKDYILLVNKLQSTYKVSPRKFILAETYNNLLIKNEIIPKIYNKSIILLFNIVGLFI